MPRMSFNITPRQGVNGVLFGLLRRQVRQALGQATASIRRNTHVPSDDIYGDREAYFRYDKQDRLEAVEFSTHAELAIDYYQISGLSYDELTQQILEWDPSAVIRDNHLQSSSLGLAVRRQPGAAAYDSVLAHRDGYLTGGSSVS